MNEYDFFWDNWIYILFYFAIRDESWTHLYFRSILLAPSYDIPVDTSAQIVERRMVCGFN